MLSDEPFKNKKVEIRDKDDVCTSFLISEHFSIYFGVKILDTLTCQTYLKDPPNLTVEDNVLFYLYGIMPTIETVQIYHHKYNIFGIVFPKLKNIL